MSIQHRDIPNAQLHEPKGINTALADTLYVADGLGSGEWRTLGAYGSQAITNNTATFAVTAAADTTFNTTSQYALLTGAGAPWAAENLFGVTFATDRLTVGVAGVYLINLWMQITGFPNNAASLAVRYRINGSGSFSTRKPTAHATAALDVGNITGFGLIPLNAGDYIQLYMASSHTGNVTIHDSNTLLQLVRQTV